MILLRKLQNASKNPEQRTKPYQKKIPRKKSKAFAAEFCNLQ